MGVLVGFVGLVGFEGVMLFVDELVCELKLFVSGVNEVDVYF